MNANRLIALALGLITVGVLALGWVLGIAPKLEEASRSDGDRALVESQNTAYEAMLADLAARHDNIDELRTELEGLQEYIPDEHRLEEFLDHLDRLAADTGVILDIVTMAEPVEVTVGDAVPAESGPVLIGIAVTVQAIGSLDGVLAFTDAAQREDRVFAITGLSFDSVASTGILTGWLFSIAVPAGADTPAEPATAP